MAESKRRSFREVKQEEEGWIQNARRARAADLEEEVLPTGLAFSGGGIRSATFNLGVLQGLARHKLLNRFDYLSTVSGGGYIGSWLMGWLHRSRKAGEPDGLPGIEQKLSPESFLPTGGEPEEAVPIRFLRKYSNYLTPRRGIFTADTWAVVSIYLRNLTLNLTILVATLSVLLLLPRAWLWLVRHVLAREWPLPLWVHGWGLPVALILLAVAFLSANLEMAYRNRGAEDDEGKPVRELPSYARPGLIQWLIVVPVILATCLLAAQLHRRGSQLAAVITDLPLPGWTWIAGLGDWAAWGIAGALVYTAIWGLGAVVVRASGAKEKGLRPTVYRDTLKNTLRYSKQVLQQPIQSGRQLADLSRRSGMAVLRRRWLILTALGGGTVAGLLMYALQRGFERFAPYTDGKDESLWLVVAAGTPLVLIVFKLSVTYHIGLMGSEFPTQVREWWGKLGAWLFIYVLAWIAAWGLVIFGPLVPTWIGKIGSGAAASGWLGSTLWGVWDGRGENASAGPWRRRLLQACPYVFVAGLLLLLSVGLHAYLSEDFRGEWDSADLESVLLQLEASLGPRLWIAIPLLAGLALLLSWRVDVNEFSMHHFYRNRLVRCYQGASSTAYGKRSPHPLTGFDPGDEIRLSELSFDSEGGPEDWSPGPYPLLNTTLNLTSGRELAWQKRRAASFVFSPLYCGFVPWRSDRDGDAPVPPEERPGFRPTRRFGGGVRLGTAMAISGAAASPNMGYHSTPALAFLMTVFNVRLGWWMANPLHDQWTSAGPGLGLMYLAAELFGMTGIERSYVYLSDGGHFENLGIYELVRRRCRFIVACDAEQDSGMTFSGLGNAVEKCRADFGVDIDIDLGRLRKPPEDADEEDPALRDRHWAVGPIRYGAQKGKRDYGILLYLKASLTGDEPADLLRYAFQNQEFPHQSTADQWFDETQFESYRRLGLHVFQAVQREIGSDGPAFERFDSPSQARERVRTFLRLVQRTAPGDSTG